MSFLNFTALQSAVQASRFDASQDMATWVRTAYEQVWNAAEWSFKKVRASDTTIVLPTSGEPTMPTDYGRITELFNDLGDELEPLEETEFFARYMASLKNGITGRPDAFTVVDRQIVLGPTPDKAYTGNIGYQRRLCTRTAAQALQVGNFVAGTDLPYWSPTEGEHHYVIALRAMTIGRTFESDYGGQLIVDEYQQALAAMMEEFTVDAAGTREYGADTL